MKRYILLLIFFVLPVFAEEEKIDLEASKEKVLDQRQNYFLTSTDYRIAPKVNPITGEYCEEEIDLVVAGSEPLSIRRFYNSSAPYDSRYASWRYNPETLFAANLELQTQEIFAAIGDADGSIYSFKPTEANSFSFNFQLPKSFAISNTDGTSHPLNTKINYWHIRDHKDKCRFQYVGNITDGSGRKRTFSSPMHRWIHFVHWTEKKGSWMAGSEIVWRVEANTWTPYLIPIIEEKLPNGNILSYSYTQWKEEKQNYPLPQLLASITAYNADKSKVLGFINFHYARAKHNEVMAVQVTGSDGRMAYMQHHNSKKSLIALASAQRAGQPYITYDTAGTYLHTITKPDGRSLTTQYNPQGKVSSQMAPVGPNGEMCPIGRYEYHDNLTIFHDAENNKTHYRYDENKKITSIETYFGNTLYQKERFIWDPITGNLTQKTLENGEGKPVLITEYQYDKNQNPILEKIGDGKEWRTLKRTYSDNGFNLKLTETDRDGKLICFTYVPDTNLIASELTYENNSIKKRVFHFYDNCAVCIKSIVDDGITENPNDLRGVTYRKITKVTPKQSLPCIGLPETIEEKTLDSNGNEILLHKTVYSYSPFGKVIKEEHYDANNSYQYSITNTYDGNEKLISQIDALGHKKTFAYDANHNLIAISGPKPEQHEETTYDKANRPIQRASWQSDGTVLLTQKKYDKLGRLIEDIDACGNKTTFQYDPLSRLVAVIHPDGAIEQKEYDLLGHLIKEIDPEGHITRRAYNCFGQVLDVTYPDYSEEHFTYNPTGTLATHRDKNGALSVYNYDIFDHCIKTEIYSQTGKLLKTLASNWNAFLKISEIDGESRIVYTYDFAGRKIGEQNNYKKTDFSFDTLGRVCLTREGDQELTQEYDALDQLTLKRKEKDGKVQFQESYAYDETGNLTKTINSQGKTTTLYNTENKPISSQDALSFLTQYLYSYKDCFTKTTINPKGIQTLSVHDSRNREAKCVKLNKDGEIIQQYENVYDKNGNKTATFHTIFSGITPIKTITHYWEYGPMSRLERFLEAGLREIRYQYDEKGRLKTIIKPSGVALSHVYDDLGRLSRFFSNDFDYAYTYDLNDRVTAIYDTVSKTTSNRKYDPLGNILEETLASWTYNQKCL